MLSIRPFTCSTIPLLTLLSGLIIPPLSAQNTGISTAPTATTLTPEQLDRQWVAATAAFAPQRARVLSSVETTIAAGPFQPDWDSLTTYTVPAWFRTQSSASSSTGACSPFLPLAPSGTPVTRT